MIFSTLSGIAGSVAAIAIPYILYPPPLNAALGAAAIWGILGGGFAGGVALPNIAYRVRGKRLLAKTIAGLRAAPRKFMQGLAMALSHYRRKKTPATSPRQLRNIFNPQGFVARHLGQALLDELSLRKDMKLNYSTHVFQLQDENMHLIDAEKCTALIKAGADVNTCDKNGNTPLMWAIVHAGKRARYDISMALIQHGADTKTKNNSGYTVKDIAYDSTANTLKNIESAIRQEQFMQAVEGGTQRKRKIRRRKPVTQGPTAC